MRNLKEDLKTIKELELQIENGERIELAEQDWVSIHLEGKEWLERAIEAEEENNKLIEALRMAYGELTKAEELLEEIFPALLQISCLYEPDGGCFHCCDYGEFAERIAKLLKKEGELVKLPTF